MAPPHIPQKIQPFLFPSVQSSVLPDPSRFFSPKLLSSPLPTNSFFQNFTLKNGDQPEYIHPYLIKSADSSLSISYSSQFHNPSFIYKIFVPDLTVSAADKTGPAHVISVLLWISPIRTSGSFSSEFSSCYPTSGDAVLNKPLCLEYKWEKKGWGDLLMLAHSLHLDILAGDFCDVKDVEALDTSAISTTSSYFYGKLIARAARLALIAEEVSYIDVIPAIRKFLKDTIEPWLDGTFNGNGFLYESKWAVLAKIDPAWGRRYKPQAYSLVAAFMNLGRRANSNYPRLRCFDLYKLHSWAGGLTEFADGRNQESTSEAVNAYYSDALMGLAYGDSHLVATGSALMAFEIQAAQTWWHVKEGDNLYVDEFRRENRVVGVLWANKRDSALWFAPPDWRECRLGIQLLPILPISEVLFSDIEFTRELVNWTLPELGRDGVGEGWKGFVYALEAIYDKESAVEKIKKLNGHDDGNSLTNLLWWVHSRGNEHEIEHGAGGKYCWFTPYCG
ncbi:unconventional myosin-XVIIIa-like [Hibiscus syriacus]|uniref:glucan endo-1,3-beta-D-glucosidase n=1 Tax=Hibiscus syriacus TaxID=106335 RepID=A0A6A3ATM7_HIBSY|nr:unconventional myosin-XVIIIa-like [Hibiscus syriacus]